MLTSTFIHIPGIGLQSERRLWQQGILTWQELLARHEDIRLPRIRRETLLSKVEESVSRLNAGDYAYFASALPAKEHWRALPEFSEKIAYLDIETTGMGDESEITLIGIYDGTQYTPYLQGQNLPQFPEDLRKYTTLVTFFGSGFDIPFIKRAFPEIQIDQFHIDLCFALKRVGYSGGLKCIEEQFGITRPDEVHGMDGWDAVRLWYEYLRGDTRSLKTLLEYNKEDVVNLSELLPVAKDLLSEKTMQGL